MMSRGATGLWERVGDSGVGVRGPFVFPGMLGRRKAQPNHAWQYGAGEQAPQVQARMRHKGTGQWRKRWLSEGHRRWRSQ